MSIVPPSGRPEFEGFPAFFETEIAPYLKSKEGPRRAAVTNYFILIGSIGALAAAIGFFAPLGEANVQIAFITGMLGFAGATWLLNRTRTDIAHGLLERICSKLGFTYRLKLERPDYYDMFKSLGLLPGHNREAWEDEVTGVYAGAPFTLCEACLKMRTSNGKSSSTRTVFHGQLFLIDYPKRFLGTTVLKRDQGIFNALTKPGKSFSRVGLASPEFEKAYEAWSTDQVEARDLLDPIVLERFQELERLYGGKKLRAAFTNGNLIIALETGDRLNMGSMFKSLEDRSRVETVLKEFDAVFDLIDVLLKRAEGKLDTAFSVQHVRGGA
ncbi:MAG: DUF3137 domain-containing protein [Pseudomonadota bacterium]|nr:DUF3137 domain-containing protein [Pseudomonadota bacterium]